MTPLCFRIFFVWPTLYITNPFTLKFITGALLNQMWMIQQLSSHNVLKTSIILTHWLNPSVQHHHDEHKINVTPILYCVYHKHPDWTNSVFLFFHGESLNCSLLYTAILPVTLGDIFVFSPIHSFIIINQNAFLCQLYQLTNCLRGLFACFYFPYNCSIFALFYAQIDKNHWCQRSLHVRPSW